MLSLKINYGTRCVLCCAILSKPKLFQNNVIQLRQEKVGNHISMDFFIDFNVLAGMIYKKYGLIILPASNSGFLLM